MSSIFSKLINLAGNIVGTLPVANGGTGLTSGTSGGVLGFTASGTVASSAALTQHAVVVGGGAGATPTTIAAGTNGQLLVGATGADPAFGSTVSAATTFSGGIVFGGAATQANLNDYRTSSNSTTYTFNGTGSPGTSASVALIYSRIGDWVSLRITSVNASSGTSSTTFTSNTAVDSFARPLTTTISFVVPAMKDNGAISTTPGRLDITSGGLLTFRRDQPATAWTNATTCGPNQDFSVTYFVGTGS